MGYELMNGDARKAIAAEGKKLGISAFPPPAVPFHSNEWLWRIDAITCQVAENIVRESLSSEAQADRVSPLLDSRPQAGIRSRGLLIQKPLKAGENLADLFGPSEISHGVGNRVVVFQVE